MRKGARVIISASGMMTGGRVLHHALRLVPDPKTTLVFVGYQAAGTTRTTNSGWRAGSKNSRPVGSGSLPYRKDWRFLGAR